MKKERIILILILLYTEILIMIEIFDIFMLKYVRIPLKKTKRKLWKFLKEFFWNDEDYYDDHPEWGHPWG